MGNTQGAASLDRTIMLEFFFDFENGERKSAIVTYEEGGDGSKPRPEEIKRLMDIFQRCAMKTELTQLTVQAIDVATKVPASLLCFDEERLTKKVDMALLAYKGSTRKPSARHHFILDMDFSIEVACEENAARNLAKIFAHFGLHVSQMIPSDLNIRFHSLLTEYGRSSATTSISTSASMTRVEEEDE
jgi:hypothetical protein